MRLTYLMFDGQYIKIGQSSDLAGAFDRLKSCQTGNPRELSIIGVTSLPEKELHERFANDHIRGEWFAVSHDLLRFIASPEVQSITKRRIKGELRCFREYV